jgi:DNA-binding NarL/FixJ family response regulator
MAKKPNKILCIEDDRGMAESLAEWFVRRCFEVGIAYDGQQGLAAILQERPDVVLCDISVPIICGSEIRERLTKIAPGLGRIPFIFMTAVADRDYELKARQLGANDYVTKPIDFEILATIIDARLAGLARNNSGPKLEELNDREIQTLTLVARGKTSAQISCELGMVKRTVDFHIDNARIKLSAATRTEAAIKAAAAGLIKP